MLKFFQKFFNFSKKYKLYYFGGRKNKNAGDIFNKDLVEFFNINYKRVRKIENSNLLCVGSNLDKIVNNKKMKKQSITVIGAGFIQPADVEEKITNELNILALRGKISQKRMAKILNNDLSNCLLADPGILVSKIYPQEITKTYRLGIIPHCFDKELVNTIQINLDKNLYTIIDIQQDVKDVVKQICECECILSSSLHGLIFADSYNIPNRQIILSERLAGGSYKFEDYYSAFDLELPYAIDLRKNIIDNNIIENIINSYLLKNLEAKQNELINLFKCL